MSCKYKRIGVSGGTFDPIHYGHLIIAEEAREMMQLDKVIFIPCGNPPHKTNCRVTPAEHRYEMVSMAVKGNEFFEVSSMEIDRGGYSYTVETVAQLIEIYGEDTKLFFIIGADVIPELVTWKQFEKLFAMCEFIATLRPGYDKESLYKEIKYLESNYHAKINLLNTPLIEISSTMIRNRVKSRKSVKYLVPYEVEEYIKEKGLYL